MARGGFNPGAGRKKGVPNKRTFEAIAIAEKLKVDPFQTLLHFTKGDWKALGYKNKTITKYAKDGTPYEEDVISPELRASSAGKACEYLYPKRKALEHSVQPEAITHIERTIITRAV